MSQRFPNLNFVIEYEEDQESFAGIYYAHNGVLTHDIHKAEGEEHRYQRDEHCQSVS